MRTGQYGNCEHMCAAPDCHYSAKRYHVDAAASERERLASNLPRAEWKTITWFYCIVLIIAEPIVINIGGRQTESGGVCVCVCAGGARFVGSLLPLCR